MPAPSVSLSHSALSRASRLRSFRGRLLVALILPALSLPLLAGDWKAAEAALSESCYRCHGGESTKGGIDLKKLAGDPSIATEHELWEKVLHTVENGEMPPSKKDELAEPKKAALLAWVTRELDVLAHARAGDPGPVTMRRLTNAEYDYTIRDLAGHSYQLTKEFQSDGGGGEGFSNTGDVLFVSPQQLDKYFSAARKVADHATVLPGTGVDFHGHRIGLRGPEQWKAQAQQGLYVWYQQKAAPHIPKDFEDVREADYMLACWKHKHFQTPLDQLAKEAGLKAAFLHNWWNLVNATEPHSRYLDLTRVGWRELPGPDPAKPGEVPAAVQEGVNRLQAELLSWNNPRKPGSGVQRQQQDSDGIRAFVTESGVKDQRHAYLSVGDIGDGNKGDIALVMKLEVRVGKNTLNYRDWLSKQIGEDRKALEASPPPANAEDLKKRLAEMEALSGSYGKHPEGRQIEGHVLAVQAPKVIALPLPEGTHHARAEMRLDLQGKDVDFATIQWSLGPRPRETTKIMPGVLTVWKIQTDAHRNTMRDFHVMKMAFPDMYERRLEEVASNLHRSNPNITVYYLSNEQLSALLPENERRELEAMRTDWSFVAPKQLDAKRLGEWDQRVTGHLHGFAARAWRRPLDDAEKARLTSLYQEGVTKELDRESAAREVIARVLVSPHFLFKAETLPQQPSGTEGGTAPLTAWEIASRLSYFLWSSLPDWELRKAAEDGSLLKPEVLSAQAKRMLRSQKSDAMAREFAGQWLEFNGFESQDTVDEKMFPDFTPEIRADMYRETHTFFSTLIREDRSVRDIVAADYTFLNDRLAKFYGIPGVEGGQFREVKVGAQQRGGLIGMGSVLTKTSRAHRTSPVLRGHYLYKVVLGQSSPPPPPNVPELPEGAIKPASLREALSLHRADQACSVCHDRIDPLGFALESYDPVGRFRPTDEGGAKVDDSAEMKDGRKFAGMNGLRNYLKSRQSDVDENFCRKLLGYALGRQVLPTDKPLIAEMRKALAAQNGKVSAAVDVIIKSQQFLQRRNDPVVTQN